MQPKVTLAASAATHHTIGTGMAPYHMSRALFSKLFSDPLTIIRFWEPTPL